MKLSEVSGERVFDVIADITEPIYSIASDKGVQTAFQAVREGEKADYADALKSIVPVLLKSHKDDLVTILASIEGTDPKEYAETITLPKLLASVYDILTDEELLAFLA